MNLRNSITVSSTGWTELYGWTAEAANGQTANGPYDFDAELLNERDFDIPITGIYYVTATIPLSSASDGKFQAAIITDDITTDDRIGLRSVYENMAFVGGRAALSVGGFMKLIADEHISVQIHSSADATYVIDQSASVVFHFIGVPGSVPAYLAQISSDQVFSNKSIIKPWITEGESRLYQSLSGRFFHQLLLLILSEFGLID